MADGEGSSSDTLSVHSLNFRRDDLMQSIDDMQHPEISTIDKAGGTHAETRSSAPKGRRVMRPSLSQWMGFGVV